LAKSGWQRERQFCQQVGLPTASVYVGKSAGQGCWQRTQLCQQFALPTAWAKLLAKPTRASGGSTALPTAWAKAVGKVIGKAENFFPFSFAVFWHLIHTSNPHISI
jgi:hypothetical protein